ncbi:DUF7601 domain-containing protein [[Clostridium] scindens]|uniref:DUF7601 domain-containing protein n=1 Tax=Clostridium scindens (strain JCM 10418 / VPI 12708) TaxID=29347 RepID=UPI00157036FD|nr:FctA domain-containing protein [[Clostridium] scindens]NSI88554.1 hypothetical protein [[Clostridium] scindens]NSJ03334.1 hypothetical protein [[Clostridium] scindens]
MKKLASIMLALTLVLGMSNVAFAADGTSSEAKAFTFEKRYETSAGETPATFPTETLKFSVTADEGNPDGTMITIADHTVASNPGSVVVTVPTYSKVGKWNYTVSEVAGTTQGVTYAPNSFGVQVLVAYDENDNLVATTAFTTTDGKEGKIDEIVNKYDLGNLSVKKNVSGNLASKTQKFDIDVKFTSTKEVKSAISGAANIAVNEWVKTGDVWTVTKTLSLAHEDALVTFNNIPAGVTYEVVEQGKHAGTDTNGSDPSKGYTVTYTGEKGTIAADTTGAATVNNEKGTTVDTGIGMDNLPYLLLLAAAFVGIVVFFAKRRFARVR